MGNHRLSVSGAYDDAAASWLTSPAAPKSFQHASANELRRHVKNWLTAYNFAKQPKALRFRTPHEVIEGIWKAKPDIFIVQPHHDTLGLNN